MHAAHQDWGGLSYDDVTDGVRWAIKEGIADPARVGIVGWSFGGYIAELAAQRNGNLFRCSVAIAGISDLTWLAYAHPWSTSFRLTREPIGKNREKLQHDSPRLHAGEFSVPILLVHGDHDVQISYDHSKLLDRALTRAGRAHRFVTIAGGDHSLRHQESDRVTLLRELESFLGQNCPAK